MVIKTRGHTDMDEKKCRRCWLEAEDNQQILCKCKGNRKMIQERDSRLVNKITKELKINNPGSKVQIERTCQRDTELVKPDITVVNEDGHCVIIEVTCPYESSFEYFQQRKTDKEKKYQSLINNKL